MADGLPESISVQTIWVGLEEAPIQMANAFIGQVEQQEIILSFGQLSPPIITADTPEGRRAQAEALSYVPIRVAGRFSVTRARVDELIAMLRQTIENYDNVQEALRRANEQ